MIIVAVFLLFSYRVHVLVRSLDIVVFSEHVFAHFMGHTTSGLSIISSALRINIVYSNARGES